MGVGEPIKFDIFFDYQCPFVFRASRLVEAVRRSGERNLDVTWRYFSLTQVNSKDEGWTGLDAPRDQPVRGRPALSAAGAAPPAGPVQGPHHPPLSATDPGPA